MEKERSYAGGFSAIAVSAALSIVALLGATTWQATRSVVAKNSPQMLQASAADAQIDVDSLDPRQGLDSHYGSDGNASSTLSMYTEIGASAVGQLVDSYLDLQNRGVYTPEAATAAAQDIGEKLQPKIQYTLLDSTSVKTDSDISKERALAYRGELQGTLAPLLRNSEAEFVVFGRYVQTKDPSNLDELRQFAQNYRAAASASSALVVPRDAVSYHLAVVNSMQEFATVLDTMASSAEDPFASAALLTSYNTAEHDMLTSFNSLTQYFKQKVS